MTVSSHTVVAHRCEVFSYQAGTRHGFECMCLDCDAGATGFTTLASAQVAAHNHSNVSWGRP